MADIFNRIFIFSSEQKKDIENTAKQNKRNIKLGTVVVNGRPKQYTDCILSMSNCKYGDAKIIAQGDIRKLTITSPIL